jgi:hypothetical protein
VAIYAAKYLAHQTIDLSNDPEYSWIIGKEYKLKTDLLIYKLGKQETELQLDAPGTSSLPDEIPTEFPYDNYGMPVIGVLPSGSSFKVKKVLLQKAVKLSHIDYQVEVITDGQFRGAELNASWITDFEDVPQFKSKYVEEVK